MKFEKLDFHHSETKFLKILHRRPDQSIDTEVVPFFKISAYLFYICYRSEHTYF